MKKYLVFLYIIICVVSLKAQIISPETAGKVAVNFYGERLLAATSADKFSFNPEPVIIQENNSPLLYVFTCYDRPGYIIISAEYAAYPVFGYSFESTYNDALNISVFQDMLSDFSEQIRFARVNKMSPSENISREWEYYSKSQFDKSGQDLKSLAPILSTTWDQGCYYNDLCPVDSQGPCGKVWAGCVATAMAQVMKFHNWPPQGTGSNIYSTPNGYGTLNANFGETVYDWSDMPNSLNYSTYNFEVAQLILHCGISVNMDYNWDGSGANTATTAQSYIEFFKYADYISQMEKDMISEDLWSELLAVELHSERPVLYRGYGSGGGHAFVCDGYQGTSSKLFHFNFGWGGAANGFYSFSNVGGFATDQAAIFSVEPKYIGPQYCEQVTILTSPSGIISDGSQSNRYANNSNCQWLIQPDNAGAILLDFNELKTEPGLDRILVYEGDSENGWLVADISGFNVPSDPIVVSGGSMFVWFFSDEFNAAPGWEATYSIWTTDVQEDMLSTMHIMPNPAQDLVNIQLDERINGDVRVIVTDVHGKKVMQQQSDSVNGQIELNVSSLSAGNYTLTIHSKQISVSGKLLINN